MINVYRHDGPQVKYFISFSLSDCTKDEVVRIYTKLAELEVEFCEDIGYLEKEDGGKQPRRRS